MGKFKNKKTEPKREVTMVNKKKLKQKNKKLLTNEMKKFLTPNDVKNEDKKAAKISTAKVGKAKNKTQPLKSQGDEFPEEMRKELEVFIKNLNRSGEIQKAFVLDNEPDNNDGPDDDFDSDSVDGDSDSVDGDAETLRDDFVEIKKEEEDIPKKKVEKRKVDMKSETSVTVKEEKDFKPEIDRADYFFVKEARQARTRFLLKPKSGEPWYSLVVKKPDDPEDETEVGVETSQYWLMKIEKFSKKILDEEVANFNAQVNNFVHHLYLTRHIKDK